MGGRVFVVPHKLRLYIFEHSADAMRMSGALTLESRAGSPPCRARGACGAWPWPVPRAGIWSGVTPPGLAAITHSETRGCITAAPPRVTGPSREPMCANGHALPAQHPACLR